MKGRKRNGKTAEGGVRLLLRSSCQCGLLRGERGFALLSVLVILAILTPLAVNFSYSARVQMAGAEYFADKIRSREVARAGLESALLALKKDERAYDSYDEDWGRFGELSQFSAGFFEEGFFTGTIDDEEGKINLNELVYAGTRNPVTVEQLERLLDQKNVDIDSIDSMIDWLDNDDETELMGAENDYYSSLDNPYNAKDGRMGTLQELRLIRGVKESLAKSGAEGAVENFLTIYGDAKVNINTAPPEVLLALAKEMDGAAVEAILAFREESPFRSIDELSDVPGLDEDTRAALLPRIKVTSGYFSVKVRGFAREISTDLYAVVQRGKNRVTIIYYGEV